MAIAVFFHPKDMTLSQFHETHARLDAAGHGSPAGRLHHSCFGTDGDLMVFDVWQSREAFESFGTVLLPVLAEVGVDPGTPDVMELHHLR